MSYHHKSGSQKRKERSDREQRNLIAERGQATLTNFNFHHKKSSDASVNQSHDSTERRDSQSFPCASSSTTIESDCNEAEQFVTFVSSDLVQEKENLSVETVVNFAATIQKSTDTERESEVQSTSQFHLTKHLHDFDIGTVNTDFIHPQLVDEVIRRGHEKMPSDFPRDRSNERFPVSLLFKNLPNGEKVERDWLVWSRSKSAFFCLPCRLFSINTVKRSYLCSPSGYSKNLVWKKLYDRLQLHENNKDHIQCYVKWRGMEMSVRNESSIDKMLCEQIKGEVKKWQEILTRILDTILFLGERGLALRGKSHLIGERNNGNFLGILELISHYDPILREHLEKVKTSQQLHQRLQYHYLSPDIQNEFIDLCARHVVSVILKEREKAKYYSLIVDATPDSAHVEQTTFILRYLHLNPEEKKYTIEERFLELVDCNKKTGAAIADLIRDTLKKHNIPLTECRGQGYDNGSNMKGEYKGAQSYILRDNLLAVYSPCSGHSLNLCGVDSAECCSKAITFFGVVQKCYAIFSSSPQRWEILKNKIGSSLHSLSETRWSARIDAVKPFANHLPGLQNALEDLTTLNLTAETRRDINGIQKYINKFECILMASIWSKILNAINERSTVLQARNATIDVEVENLKSLLSDMQQIRNQWDAILRECKLVASGLKGTSSTLPVGRRKKRAKTFSESEDEDSSSITITDEETDFKINTFYVIVDSVIAGISNRFTAMNDLNNTFSFLWKFTILDEEDIRIDAINFVKKYAVDVSKELIDEIIHLKHIYESNFEAGLSPFDLLNAIISNKLETLFSNICVALRIFCTLPVSVASGERSFSVLSRIKNFHRSCSTQTRVTGLGTLCLESALARQLDFKILINAFASAKARKAHLKI